MVPAAGPALLAIVGGTLALLLGLLLLLLPLLATELSRPRDSVWGAVVLLLGLVLVTSADRLTGAPMLAVLCGGLLIGRLSSEVGLGRWRQLTDDERRLLASSERWSRSVQQLGAASTSLLERAGGLLSGLATRVASRPPRPGSSKRWVRPELAAAAAPADSPLPVQPLPVQPLTVQSTAASDSSSSLEPAAEEQPQPASEPAAASPEAESDQATTATGAAEAESETADPVAAAAQQSAPAADGAERTRVVKGFEEITALLAAAPLPEAEPSEAG
jgi:hypothetical protein